MTETQIRGTFLNVINKLNAHKDLGMPPSEFYNYKKPERQTVKNMLYILYLANKLKIDDTTGKTE